MAWDEFIQPVSQPAEGQNRAAEGAPLMTATDSFLLCHDPSQSSNEKPEIVDHLLLLKPLLSSSNGLFAVVYSNLTDFSFPLIVRVFFKMLL